MDVYAVLGVKKEATIEEVRRAYRKLAVKLHPDKNPGDKDAEAKFKVVGHAYDILSSEDGRKKYDLEKEAAARPPPPPPNYPTANVSVEIEIDAYDIQHGSDKTVTVSRPRRCPMCRGTGRIWNNWQTCGVCMGAGCEPCEWTGRLIHCGQCWGTGKDKDLTTLVIRIPAGTPPHGRQRFVAYGSLWGVQGPFYVNANVVPRVFKPGLIIR